MIRRPSIGGSRKRHPHPARRPGGLAPVAVGRGRALVVAICLLVTACAQRELRVQDDFLPSLFQPPAAGSGVASRPLVGPRFLAGWADLQSGNLRAALGEFEFLVRDSGLEGTDLHPFFIGVGIVRLLSGAPAAALTEFDRVLAVTPDEPQARLGRAAVMYQLGDDEGTLVELGRLAAAAPSNPGVARLRARSEARLLAHVQELAQRAELASDRPTALAHLRRATELSPLEVGLRKREAALALALGEQVLAIAAYRAVTELAPDDAEGWLGLGEVQMAAGEHAAARLAFDRAAQLPGGLELARERVVVLRERQQVQGEADPRLRRATESATLDRAGLAALMVSKLPRLERVQRPSSPQILTDIAGSWARAEIQTMVALHVLDVYDNHTFRPQGAVSRLMLARAAAAVLRICREAGWLAERPFRARSFSDVPAEHLDYPAVIDVLRYEVMEVDADSGFRPADPVGGAEALAVLARLAALVG